MLYGADAKLAQHLDHLLFYYAKKCLWFWTFQEKIAGLQQ